MFVVTEDWYFCSHRLPLAIAALKNGFDVSVVTRVADHEQRILAAGITIIPFEMSRRGFNPIAELRTVSRLMAIYRDHAPDIIHHVALKPVILGSFAALMVRAPAVVNAIAGMGYVFSSKDGMAKLLRLVLGRLLPVLLKARPGRVIVQNSNDKEILQRLGLEAKRIALIHGAGVDPEEFQFTKEPPDPITVILPTRMIKDKGIEAFVAAAEIIRARDRTVRFALVGKPDDGNPSSIPLAKLEEWNRTGKVEWWGHRSDMPLVFQQCHLVCFPSTYGEGIPKVLIEAAASGRAIVATDMPGCREIVRDGENGYLVPPGNEGRLVGAMLELMNDPAKRAVMGTRGRALVLSEFTLDRVIAATLRLYREVSRP